MSDLATADVQPGADTSAADGAAALTDDAALGAVWDKLERDNGADRGANGRFANADGDAAEGGDEADGGEGDPAAVEGQEGGDEAAATAAVPLPANWNGMDEDWKKIPADVQTKIAARDAELHARMSEQGRQIGAAKPFMDIVDRNRDLFEGKKTEDGSDYTPDLAVDFMMGVQRRLDSDPIRTIIAIADHYGARDMLAGVLTGQIQLPASQQRPAAGLTPADVDKAVERAMTERTRVDEANAELSRLSKDKPLYGEIAEADMVHAIHRARSKLGDTASKEAVFNLAYDMAVNADPDLRAKAAAAKAAAAPKPDRRAADARRANDVNVVSRSTGKGRVQTEDEVLGAAYDAAQSKDR